MTAPVVTRFAPSPTGFLHIGGARTALFNWLYARATGGTMALRIEDTDRARSTQGAIDAILEGLAWLGLDWEGDVVYQSARAGRHAEVAEQLLGLGHAYRCYASAEEMEAMREAARAQGRAVVYDGLWRNRDPAEAPEGVKPVLRFKAPKNGETVVEDAVQGRVTYQNADLDDLVLLRSDGTPTYMLAVVVDDHDMGVTHVIRGDDHLNNAARQTQIYRALGWDVPAFAHVPLIHGPDGAKLSKRHGALGTEVYRAMGYLPEALRNYLVRLGWSHGDDEIMSTVEMIDWFGLDAIGRSPARFDFAKLENLNGHYMRAGDPGDIAARTRDDWHLLTADMEHAPSRPEGAQWELFARAVPHLKERARTLVDLVDAARFLFAARPLDVEPKAAALLDGDARAHLAAAHERLAVLDTWSLDTVEAAVRAYAESADLKLGKIAQPLRAALTGRTASPGIFEVMELLGREETLGRIADQASSA